ncbi:hypothetical protein [Staphylococcus lugdunensis]|uniref:hypothetical protein n=2 Tax=Staphylococcus TaxID=1279 RepID=UPI0004B2DEAC|nr:hypothetical protein [Staphylococcus lugdunensis]MDU1594056.1 hypothetical protein [Staphylococcus lugdunensis]MDU7612873.1 hypothetical protein [Staphylococcus lugdunensis]UZW89262.1 hypothetical protein LE166_02145 [Staphylococcus lugdunensis]BBN84944.1 mobile element protein [Staphylococcus lugdunensis]
MYETIPDNEFNHHRGATSYHPKMITSCTLSNTQGKRQFLSNNFNRNCLFTLFKNLMS